MGPDIFFLTTNGKRAVKAKAIIGSINLSLLKRLEQVELTDSLEVLSALTNTPAGDMLDIPDTESIVRLEQLIAEIKTLTAGLAAGAKSTGQLRLKLPAGTINATLPESLTRLATGAYINSATAINDDIARRQSPNNSAYVPSAATVSTILAHCLYACLPDTPYSEHKAAALQPVADQLPLGDTLPLAHRFTKGIIEMMHTEQHLFRRAAPSTDIELKAGIEKFSVFGYLNYIDTVAKDQHLSWADTMKMPYCDYLTILMMIRTRDEYQKKWMELSTRT